MKPNYESLILENRLANPVPNAPTGKVRLIDRNGIFSTIDDAGVENDILNNSASTFVEGTYTPVASGVAYGTRLFADPVNYVRMGGLVTVWGAMQKIGNGATVTDTFLITLPITPAAFTSESDCAGGAAPLSIDEIVSVFAVGNTIGSTLAEFTNEAVNADNQNYIFNFVYRI